MVLYGFLEISKISKGDAKITVRCSFSYPVSHFFWNFEVSFMVLYGFLEISKISKGDAKITVRSSFSCSVSYFFRNFEVSFMAVYGVLEIFKLDIDDGNITIPCFFLSPLFNVISNFGGVSKITVRLCFFFLSHSNNKLQIKCNAFPEDVVVVTIAGGFCSVSSSDKKYRYGGFTFLWYNFWIFMITYDNVDAKEKWNLE